LNLAAGFFRQDPRAIAVIADGVECSYGELAERVQRVAHWLQGSRRVGILASRSLDACTAVLAACHCGIPYVPVNLKLPPERVRAVLDMSGVDALIGRVLDSTGPVRSLASQDELPERSCAPVDVSPESLAYIIFTSGSTGEPKGVMVSAGSVQFFLAMMQKRYELNSGDRVSEATDLSFDVSVQNMFMAWNAGATLCVVPPGQAMAPAKFIQRNRLTVWSSVPSVISFMQSTRMLTLNAFPTLRYSLFSGDALPLNAALAWQAAAPNSIVDNLYGPTETTVVCLGQRLTETPVVTPERGLVAIGAPLPGTEAAILDEQLHFLADGQPGELAIGGPQLAEGYLDAPELTRERFLTLSGQTWYRTGDLARRDANGIFHHLGRLDNQVKVFGYRVELEEIEGHLRSVCDSDQVACVAWPVANGSASGIVAFVCCDLPAASIREMMKQKVASYMVPGAVHRIVELPLNAHGKLDRAALLERL
jgi:D-alanine--poly(phosphoribitol) ligase subunit 1